MSEKFLVIPANSLITCVELGGDELPLLDQQRGYVSLRAKRLDKRW